MTATDGMTRADGERNSTKRSGCAVLRNPRFTTGGRRLHRAYLGCQANEGSILLVPAAAEDSFSRWESSHGEVPMLATAMSGHWKEACKTLRVTMRHALRRATSIAEGGCP